MKKWEHPSRDSNGNKVKLYERWSTMKQRCNPNSKDLNHKKYRDNNIKICKEWESYDNFAEWALNNGYNDNLTLDRLDVMKDYEPSNCRWIPLSENVKLRNESYDYSKMKTAHVYIRDDGLIVKNPGKYEQEKGIAKGSIREAADPKRSTVYADGHTWSYIK